MAVGTGSITSESAQERDYAVLNTRRRRALACAGVTAALCAAIAPQALAGPLNAGGSVDLLTESNVRIGNLAAAAKVGDKIVSAGDFNGDGFKDVALGMWMLGADGPTRAAGRRGLRGLRQGLARPPPSTWPRSAPTASASRARSRATTSAGR